MRKGGARSRSKRVSAAPKKRQCGVPWSILVAAWTLFPLLLLTSSISHRDDEQHVLEQPDFAIHELAGERLLERGSDPLGDAEDVFRFVHSSSDEKPVLADYDSEDPLSISDVNSRDKTEEPPSLSAEGPPTRVGCEDMGEPMDALRYAEYGAGMLQKSAPAEDRSEICLIRNSTGTGCRVVGNLGEFAGTNCVWRRVSSAESLGLLCSNDKVGSDEHCHRAKSHGNDVVADLEGGEHYLFCQMDLPAKRVDCDAACITESDCLLPGVDTANVCQFDGGKRDILLRLCQTEQVGSQLEAGIAEELESAESPISVQAEELQSSSSITEEHVVELFPSTDLNSNSLIQEDLEELRKLADDRSTFESTFPKDVVDVAIVHDEGKIVDVVVVKDGEIVDLEFLAPLVESELTGRESLLDPAEPGTLEEDDVIEPAPVVAELLVEPRVLKRVGSVMSLDEYKRSVLENQRKTGNQVNLSTVPAHKVVRHTDESYNYASATHGAKLLASNKEAKGASSILTSDKDKYLRNPCGAEDKHVVMELSEETVVDTIFIANFEFHSSNLKDFEVLGSPIYPSKDWISLGKFRAENVRQRQKFVIEDPKLVRYLAIKMLTHWGSEFFCTLSNVEVFGVDVIKNLLDDWIALEEIDNNARAHQEEPLVPLSTGQKLNPDDLLDASFMEPLFTQTETRTGSADPGVPLNQDILLAADDDLIVEEEPKQGSAGDFAQEVIHSVGGKPPGDSVLKILMQRVKALELNQTVFDLYLGELNQKYKVMLSELDKDLALVTERLRNETALTASLAMRLADRELQRKEEKLYMEHRFAQIASNFTDTLDFMRWQIQSTERRELTAVLLTFVCMILSALLHLLASCMPRKSHKQNSFTQTKRSDKELGSKLGETKSSGEVVDSKLSDTKSSGGLVDSKQSAIESHFHKCSPAAIFQVGSSFVLYVACGMTILVLSV